MEINWAVILLTVIVAALILIKFTDLKHRIRFIVLGSLLIFGALSLGYVYMTNDFDLKNFNGWLIAGKVYLGWLSNFAFNLVKISGYAIQQDWKSNISLSGITG